MRNLYLSLAFLASAGVAIFISTGDTGPVKRPKMPKAQRIQGAIEDKKFTSSDVDSGIIPYDKLFAAIREGQKRVDEESGRSVFGTSLADAIFRERGPNNVGGRTRAIHVDEKDPNRNRVWVGGVSGGVWRTEDITQDDPQWEKLGIYFENISIGDIAQDPNNMNTFYVGTGESYAGTGGTGIFKSTDDGASWTLLPSTVNFTFINEMYVHTNSDLYAATGDNGLLRSKDGGQTWEKVIGVGLAGADSDDFHDIIYNEVNQHFYTSNSSTVYKSATGNRADWINIGTDKPGFPGNLTRVEVAVCPTNPNVMYVLGGIGGSASATFISNDGGESWISRPSPSIPPYPDCTDIACGQAGYDLDIAVDPVSCGHIVVGGITLWESTFQAISWQKNIDEGQAIGAYHHDQHTIYFDPKNPGRIYYGNDGGIYMSVNNGQSAEHKNLGYVTTQFYCGAIHPNIGSPYILGGTQDNGSLQVTEAGLSPANKVYFGDGVFCFIDQNQPNIQIVSSQEGNYGLSRNGGFSFGFGASVNGAFINRSGYDSQANILYGQVNQSGVGDVDFFRWNIDTEQVDIVDLSNFNINISAVRPDPFVANRVYFGGQAGLVIQVDNAHNSGLMQATVYEDLPGNASVSSIYKDSVDQNHMLVSMFNYGSNLENLWVTYDGGAEFTAIEGDLPDMPVNWAIFDPSDHDRAMIATEAGVWVTDNIDGALTHWVPISADNGMPFVDVDMLVMRNSDKVVLAATYGRGLMTTDVFSAPAAVITAQPIAYVGQPVVLDGSQSVNADSYFWEFGDNTTSTSPVASHAYTSPGVYTIKLTINGGPQKEQTISILPYLPAPYQKEGTDYAGDFESHPEHFATYTPNGTSFQRGVSDKPGKDGTFSGANAYVLGPNNNLYQNNTRAEIYTPMYDMTEQGLYEFRFYGKYAVQSRNDGFQVEYSTNGGVSWTQLGDTQVPNWYNYFNENITNGAFPQGKSYFTHAQLEWKQYVKDISFLAGQSAVSFRFVFRSDGDEPAQGVAIDDFEITKYDGELKTTVTVFNAEYTGDQEITINWTTGIEYQCKRFEIERSYTGFGFEEVLNQPAKSGVSSFATNYTRTDQNLHDVIFYRMKVINENTAIGYEYIFYTDTIVVRRNVEPDVVFNVSPNPFADQIGMSFSSVVDKEVAIRLYDAAGRLIIEQFVIPNAVAYTLDQLNLPTGIYVLTVKIGDGDLNAYKLFTNGG